MTLPRTAMILLAGLLASAPAPAADIAMDVIGTPEIVRPKAVTAGAVVLFSGAAGWGDGERSLARSLAERGTVVIGIDSPATARRMAAEQDSCVGVIGEIEDVSHQIQREMGSEAYHFPILAGIGAGGTFALAVAAQTANATIDRVVAVDPELALPVRKPLCTEAPRRDTPAGTVYGLPPGPAPFPIAVAFTPAAGADGRVHAATLQEGRREVTLTDVAAAPAAALLATLGRSEKTAADSLADLPLVELPVSARSDAFAVLYSGDGGWRDLDKDLAALLQKEGLPVVGVDVLRYFWKRQTPEQSARDLSRIIHAYQGKWGARQVVLVGFSFGADILPPVFNRLPATDKADVIQISLLGMSDTADFEVTVAEWLNSRNNASLPTIPEAKRLDPRRVQCFYGRDDEDAACSQLHDSGVEIISTAGGHHFDGDYPALARRILEGMRRRQALPGGGAP